MAAALARARIEQGWPIVAWISAETKDRMLVGLSELAHGLNDADPNGDSEELARRARRFLETTDKPSLLIFDNAENVDLLRPVLPSRGRSNIVITSTHTTFERLGRSIPVVSFSKNEAARYLQERTGLDDVAGANSVSAEVDGLPLALAQMASVIWHQRLKFGEYLERFRKLPIASVARRYGDPYGKAVAPAIRMSVENFLASREEPLREATLMALSLMSPEGVSRAILYPSASNTYNGQPNSRPAVAAIAEVDEALAALVEASLGLFSVDGVKIHLHRLIARVVAEDALRAGRLADFTKRTVSLLAIHFNPPGLAWDDWTGCSAFIEEAIEHVSAVWHVTETSSLAENPEVAHSILTLRGLIVGYLAWTSDSNRAMRLGVSTLEDARRILGPEDAVILFIEHNLATAYRHQGQLHRAELMLERVLAIRRKSLGLDHPDTEATLNQLALVYRRMGRLEKAKELHHEVIESRKRTMGADHAATLGSLNDLGTTLRLSGQLQEAVDLLESTLEGRRKLLGGNNRDTLETQYSLASAYRQLGRLHDADKLYSATICSFEKTETDSELGIVVARNELALTHRAAGQLESAAKLHEECSIEFQRILGPHHPNTLSCLNDLAFVYHSMGKYAEAAKIREDLLVTYRTGVLGPDHPDILTCRHDLAWSYRMMGRVTEAVNLHRQAWLERNRVLGDIHPATHSSEEHLGLSLRALGQVEAAVEHLEHAWGQRKLILGGELPQTLTSANSLALGYRSVGRLEDALKLQEQTLTARLKLLGSRHPRTLLTQIEMAETLRQIGNASEAVRLIEGLEADLVSVLGTDHPSNLLGMHTLGTAHASAGNWRRATSLLGTALGNRQRVLGLANPDTLLTKLAYSCTISDEEGLQLVQEVHMICCASLESAHPLISLSWEHEQLMRDMGARNCLRLIKD